MGDGAVVEKACVDAAPVVMITRAADRNFMFLYNKLINI